MSRGSVAKKRYKAMDHRGDLAALGACLSHSIFHFGNWAGPPTFFTSNHRCAPSSSLGHEAGLANMMPLFLAAHCTMDKLHQFVVGGAATNQFVQIVVPGRKRQVRILPSEVIRIRLHC